MKKIRKNYIYRIRFNFPLKKEKGDEWYSHKKFAEERYQGLLHQLYADNSEGTIELSSFKSEQGLYHFHKKIHYNSVIPIN